MRRRWSNSLISVEYITYEVCNLPDHEENNEELKTERKKEEMKILIGTWPAVLT
jgi:hypothetical protein